MCCWPWWIATCGPCGSISTRPIRMRASLAAFQISAQLLGLGKQRVVERHGDAHHSVQSRHRLMPIPMRRIAIRALVIHAMRSTIAAHGQTVVPAPISVVPVSLSANRAGTACTKP